MSKEIIHDEIDSNKEDHDLSEAEQEHELEKIATKSIDISTGEVKKLRKDVNAGFDVMKTSTDMKVTIREHQKAANELKTLVEGIERKHATLKSAVDAEGKRVKEMRKVAEEVREVWAPKEKGALYTRAKFWSWVLPGIIGVGSMISTIVIGIITANILSSAGDATDKAAKKLADALLEEQFQELVKRQIERWLSSADELFWGNLATYVDQFKPALMSQIIMLSYVKNLTKGQSDTTAWTWQADEQADLVAQLQTAYGTAKKSSELYRKVVTLHVTRAGASKTLPKYQAADCCELALANLISGSGATPSA